MLNYKNTKICTKVLDINQIKQYYTDSAKDEKDSKFGLEYERIAVDSLSLKSADYNHIEKIIKNFAHIKNWGILYDEKTIIGAMGEGSSISLEPGCQFELSLEAKSSLAEIEKCASDITLLLDRIAKFYNVEFLPYGITPKSVFKNIDIVKKQRYEIMANYLPLYGKLAPVMMRETAGVQLNVDYKDEKDAIDKIKLFSYISPFLTGLFANSPIREDKLTNFKSYRAFAWKYTGKNRCGLFYKNLLDNKDSSFEDYIEAVLDVPMLFIERVDKKIPINGSLTFRKFMQSGYHNHCAVLEDYILHSSLTFPDVRLKKCIEIRNHDSQNLDLAMAVCAFYKGILACDFSEIFRSFESVTSEDIDNMGYLAARYGINFKYKNFDSLDFTKKLFEIAKSCLSDEEKHYLKPAFKLLELKMCPADIIIKENIKTADALIEYLRSK